MRILAGAGAIALAVAFAGGAWAQGARSSVSLPQSNGGEEQPGQTAPVGAGSADAATTGVSGPQSSTSGGEISIPPVPSEELCQNYAGQPAYQPCLATVTAEGSQP